MKNILLGIVAFILSICLVGLIFLATNQNALAKVHQTICTFSKVNKVSYIENTLNLHANYTAKASEKDENDNTVILNNKNDGKNNENNSTSYHFTPQERNIIALNYANHHLKENYQLNKMQSTSPTSKYSFSDDNNKQQIYITVDENGHVKTEQTSTH